MTTLHDRLGDLADQAPAGAVAAAPDLWAAGRRLHHRQRIGTGIVVATVVALLGGLTGFSWSRSDVDVQPAGPESELGMPDRFYAVSERLSGTDDTGPIGPLSAVLTGYERLVGISGTGEYAYLDLPAWPEPDSVDDFPADLAVSDDGTQLAYWGIGQPSGEPVSTDVDPVVSVRVYDAVTGDVLTYAVPTEHGLSPQDLVWAGDTLWFEVWQYEAPQDDGGRGATLEQTVAWNPATDAHTTWEGRPAGVPSTRATSWQDALVTLGGQGALRLTRTGGSELRARISGSPQPSTQAFLEGSGGRLASLLEPSGTQTSDSQPLLVADLPDQRDLTSPVSMREVPGTAERPLYELFGWRDTTHVVAIRYGERPSVGFVSVDVETGEMEALAPLETNVPEFAADALKGPIFDAPPPPDPLDLRLVYGGIAAILLAGAASIFWWRRRVQR